MSNPYAISIHVPAWGTTMEVLPTQKKKMYFNPRSRVGNDVGVAVLAPISCLFQSTFPRGERQNVKLTTDGICDFNPRSRVGNDGSATVSCSFAVFSFQSTFPRGERQPTMQSVPVPRTFQSTFPRGERLSVICT